MVLCVWGYWVVGFGFMGRDGFSGILEFYFFVVGSGLLSTVQ